MGCDEALHLLLEINILQHTCTHPNVVQLMEVIPRRVVEGYSYYDQLYLVFNLVETDLEKRIITGKPFSDKELKEVHARPAWRHRAAQVFHQILRGVACIHEAGIVHRDIKPNNILMSYDGQVQVADLGCAVAQGKGSLKVECADPELVGTPSYQPPELLLRSAKNDPAMDMWAAGCILGEMMAMQQLFRGDSVDAMLDMVMCVLGRPSEEDLATLRSDRVRNEALSHCKPWPAANWSRLLPESPPAAVDLLERLLRFNPSKRYKAKSALAHPIFSSINADTKSVVCQPGHGPADGVQAAMKIFEFNPQSTNCLQQIWAEIRDQVICC